MKLHKIVTFLGLLTFSSLSWALNINTSDAETIQQELKGIGAVKAQAIVQYRTDHGYFSNSQELLNVPGIGPKTLESIVDALTFDLPLEENSTDSNP